MTEAERGGETSGLVAVAGVRREPVDVKRVDAGVGTGRQDRLQRQHELGIGRTAPLGVRRLADADDSD
jgi:hypothetical protein